MSKSEIRKCNTTLGNDEYHHSLEEGALPIIEMGLNYSSSCISIICCILFTIIFLAVFFSTKTTCALNTSSECTPNSGFNVGTILLLVIIGLLLLGTIVNTILMYTKKNKITKVIQNGRPCYSEKQKIIIERK